MTRLAPLVIVALLVGSFVGSVALVDPPMPGVRWSYPDPDPAPAPGPAVVGSGFTTFDSTTAFDTYLDASHRRYDASRSSSMGVSLAPGWDSAGSHDPESNQPATVVVGDTLVVFGQRGVTGYNVSDPAHPEREWRRSVTGEVVRATHRAGSVFAVFATETETADCPIEPMAGASSNCTAIYHPDEPVPADVVYTVVRLDPTSGRVQDTISLVGSQRSTVHAAENALYFATTEPASRSTLLLDFLLTDARPLLPLDVVGRLERIRGQPLSDRAAYEEADRVLDGWLSSLSAAEQRKVHQRLRSHYHDYVDNHRTELQTTHVAEIHWGTLAVATSGTVPGVLSGPRALDAHEGNLRLATTVDPPRIQWGPVSRTSRVYVLDSHLEVVGSTQAASPGEQVTAARFAGETGYVSTAQADAIHVFNLSTPAEPRRAGSVTMLGTHRILRPVTEDHVLTVQAVDDRVHAGLLDASTPENPHVVESRVIDAAEPTALENSALTTFRGARRGSSRPAGLLFVPTAAGGRVLTVDELSAVATVDVHEPRRAVSVGNHLYVFGQSVVVVNEATWVVERRIRR